MAVPKITETRCRDGSVQARQVIKRLHKQTHPYILYNSTQNVLASFFQQTYQKHISDQSNHCYQSAAKVQGVEWAVNFII